jgi:prepilin-type processing-associated H-X9-DG protein
MLAMDGRPRNQTNDNWIMVFNSGPDDTLYDFVQLTAKPDNGFGKQAIDYWRHSQRAGVVFVDAHAESIGLDEAGMKSVGLSRGLR